MSGGAAAMLLAALQPPYGGNDAYTKLLISGNGPDGSTAIKDISAGAHTVTCNGDAQISTAQSKFGGSSIVFDGTGDYLSVGNHADWNFGTGDYTLELMVRRPVSQASFAGLFSGANSTGTSGWGIGFNGTTNCVYVGHSGALLVSSPNVLPANQWVHVAVVRSGASLVIYYDGVAQATYNIGAAAMNSGGEGLWIGHAPGAASFSGNLASLRISKGIARWTGNFAPPARPYT